jgi:drug/metabolite transporter (DMT)-like permease
MKTLRWTLPLEMTVVFYLIAYIPNIILTKLTTTQPAAAFGRPLSGLETLPSTLIINMVLTLVFFWLSGWHRDANGIQAGPVRIPVPGFYTFLSGIGTSLILFTVPLSFTLEGVSIPFIQLLMRGDILIIAPIVDFMFGRKVRWWSWAALVMVCVALLVVVKARGNLYLPPLAIATVVLYTLGYFLRLAVMTKISKSGDEASVRRYFVEEKIVALPLSILALYLLAASGISKQADQLTNGFIHVWSDPVIWKLAVNGFLLTIISVLAAIILLDKRENSYCVPLERSASLLAGIIAALVMAWVWGLPQPTTAELTGAGILIGAIFLLALAPRFSKR